VRSLAEVTDAERREYLEDFTKTVLNGPLEAAQFHFQIEGVTRSITHQMVRSRASFFAQESLRFAVPEGNWAEEIPLPASIAGAPEERRKIMEKLGWERGHEPRNYSERLLMLDAWEDAMINAQNAYTRLIELGMPAEEARGVLPHDMPTRIHWVMDLRTLLTEAGKRTCTQAQFPWRIIFAGMAKALREHTSDWNPNISVSDGWQFSEIADRLRPVCFQTGSCGFMAQFDRSCKIRSRVDANSDLGRPSSEWGNEYDAVQGNPIVTGFGPKSVIRTEQNQPVFIGAIQDWEWAADPGAARS
jgi:flavin-dependent thymidylate synthase